jgi:AcrR family transcriptional regulator
MTRAMNLPPARDRIVQAAISLFAHGGYYKTGTRDIARVADVSEVTLFRHFERKEDVFLSALRSTYSTVGQRLTHFQRDAFPPGAKETLQRVIRLLLDVITYCPEVLQLSAVALFEMRGEARDECLTQLSPLISAIEVYLSAQMESGTFRRLNLSLTTTAIMLTAIAQANSRNPFENSKPAQAAERDQFDKLATFWTRVLMPDMPVRGLPGENLESGFNPC